MRSTLKIIFFYVFIACLWSAPIFGQAQKNSTVAAPKPLDKLPAGTIAISRDVTFDIIRSRGAGGGTWSTAFMELVPNQNPDPKARNPEFLEEVELSLHLAYEMAPDATGKKAYDFYSSKVRIAILKARERVPLSFFLPGYIVERDRLPREPKYWAVEISISGIPQETSPNLVCRDYKTPQMLKFLPSFLGKVAQEGRRTEGLLMPQYLTPRGISGQVRTLDLTIPFIREEGGQR
ncbi:MAG: hypothetical protein HOD72_15660 [Opitutae bacterium]|nr:hypothetical protein [Opitutae bacterium]